ARSTAPPMRHRKRRIRTHGAPDGAPRVVLRERRRRRGRRRLLRGIASDASGCAAASLRILLVSQMYPGPADPDLGVFVRGLEEQLVARGHEVERAVLDHRGGSKMKYLRLARATSAAARRLRPDVVYAH